MTLENLRVFILCVYVYFATCCKDVVNLVDTCQHVCRLHSHTHHKPKALFHVQHSAATFNAVWRGQPGCISNIFLFVPLGCVHHCNLHCAPQYGQHFATLSNMLGQLYPRPSEARSLSPLNLPNYASHQLFSHSIAVISEPHTLMCCLSFFIFVHPFCALWGFMSEPLISCSHYLSLLFSPLSPLSLLSLLRHPHILILL